MAEGRKAAMTDRIRILVVDDEWMIQEAVSSYLEAKGYGVRSAETGKDALQILEEQPISLVILDLMLPDISGEKLCARIRKRSRVPIIMLTAKKAEEDMLKGFDLGADDYIGKPFSLKNLHARVQAILRRSSDDLKPLSSKLSWNDGDLVIDYDGREVRKKGEAVSNDGKDAVLTVEDQGSRFIVVLPREQRLYRSDDLCGGSRKTVVE